MNDLSDYVPYSDAYSRLDRRLQTTPHEMAQWISVTKDGGGLNAYEINRFGKPILFKYHIHGFHNNKSEDFISPLRKLYILNDDIERFQPVKRYISRLDWIKRLADIYGDKSLALQKAIESGKSPLFEYHPIAGGVEPEGELFCSGLFDLDDVKKIESLHFPVENNTKAGQDDSLPSFVLRKNAFVKWLENSKVDVSKPDLIKVHLDTFATVRKIYETLKTADSDVWQPKFESFQRDFWQRYCKETGYGRSKN